MPPINCTSKGRIPSARPPPRAPWRRPARADRPARRRWRAGLELLGAGGEFGVGESLQLVLHGVDRLDLRPGRLDAAIVGGTENLSGDTAETDHQWSFQSVVCRQGAGGTPVTGHLGQVRTTKSVPKRFWTQRRRTDKRGPTDVNAAPMRHSCPGFPPRSARFGGASFSRIGDFFMPRPFYRALALPLALSAIVAVPALAQETAPAEPPAAPAAPAARDSCSAGRAGPAKVVATIEGIDDHRGRPHSRRASSASSLRSWRRKCGVAAALSAIIEIRLLAAKAVEKAYDKTRISSAGRNSLSCVRCTANWSTGRSPTRSPTPSCAPATTSRFPRRRR